MKIRIPSLRNRSGIFLTLAAFAVLTSQTQAAAVFFDVVTGTTAQGSSTNYPGAESPPKAIDGNFYTKYLNFDKLNTGVIINGANSAIPVTRLNLVTANDATERDPASYTLEGSNDGSSWSTISSGGLGLPSGRNTTISDFNVYSQTVDFANTIGYSYYRVLFPTVKNAGAAYSMQIAEISLLGLYDPGTDICDLQSYTATDVGGSYPGGEAPPMLIDNNPDTKYLNFGKEGCGANLTTTGSYSVVTGLTITQANDAVARDVAAFTLRGSTDGSVWTDIVTNLSMTTAMGLFESNTVTFSNTTAYRDYQFIVTGLRSSGDANSFQLAELQLHGTLVPEAGTTALGLAGLILLARRRRA